MLLKWRASIHFWLLLYIVSNYGKPQGFKHFLVIPAYIFVLIGLLRQISVSHFCASDPDCHVNIQWKQQYICIFVRFDTHWQGLNFCQNALDFSKKNSELEYTQKIWKVTKFQNCSLSTSKVMNKKLTLWSNPPPGAYRVKDINFHEHLFREWVK